jgi:hypothetical protein
MPERLTARHPSKKRGDASATTNITTKGKKENN